MSPDENAGHEHEHEHEAPNRRGALIGLVLVVALVVIGIITAQILHKAGRLQDCVMSGRSNCAPIAH